MKQDVDRCRNCVFTNSYQRVCPYTRVKSDWYLDVDGCMTRTVEGGVCAKIWEEAA